MPVQRRVEGQPLTRLTRRRINRQAHIHGPPGFLEDMTYSALKTFSLTKAVIYIFLILRGYKLLIFLVHIFFFAVDPSDIGSNMFMLQIAFIHIRRVYIMVTNQ